VQCMEHLRKYDPPNPETGACAIEFRFAI